MLIPSSGWLLFSDSHPTDRPPIADVADPARAWELLLKRPLLLLRGERVLVLLFDALDEAGGTPERSIISARCSAFCWT